MNNSVRVLPLLVVAGICLFALKAMGLLFSGGYVVSGVAPANAQNPDVAAKPPAEAKTDANKNAGESERAEEKPSPDEPTKVAAADASTDGSKQKPAKKINPSSKDVSDGPLSETPKSELAVLEGLSNRRKDLDKRETQIDLRENLLRAAEKRVEARITELKSIQAKIEGELKKQDDFRKGQYENLVKMYSAMKPKDAARIFNRMELDVLTGMAIQMKPRVMSAIMAKMDSAAAERLTLEIASRGKVAPKTAAALPKIESANTN